MLSADDRHSLQRSGALLASSLQAVAAATQPGVTTGQLSTLAEQLIRDGGGVPAFLGHQGFPAALCTSVNDEVVHGIPGDRELVTGDIVGLDLGVKLDGWYTDSAVTVAVGTAQADALKLLQITRQALELALGQARAGRTTGDLGAAVQAFVESAGCAVVRDCVGHGIGRSLHEEPSIPNFGTPGAGSEFTVGMVVAIEPMVTLGDYAIETAADKWTIRTRDRSLAAHFEETVIITENDPQRLTPLPGVLQAENQPGRLGKVA